MKRFRRRMRSAWMDTKMFGLSYILGMCGLLVTFFNDLSDCPELILYFAVGLLIAQSIIWWGIRHLIVPADRWRED